MSLQIIRRQLQKAFLFASVTGFIIMLMFIQSENDKYAFWLLVIPMFVYIIYGHQISNKYKYLPEFSDTVYYLGFTFTLMALFGATAFGKLDDSPEKTIAYFGMALMTTIIGLIYRNYHMQFTDLNEDAFEKAQAQIDEEMSEFQDTIDNLQLRLNLLVDNIENVSDILTNSLPNKISEANENIDERLISSFSKLENDMNDMDVLFKESFTKLKSLYENLNEQNSTTIQDMVTSMEGLSNNFIHSISNIENSTEEMAHQTQSLQNNLNNFNEQLSSNGDGNGLLDITINSFKENNEELKLLTSGIKNLNKSYRENLTTLHNTSELIGKEVKQIEKIFEDVETHIVKKFK